MNGVTEYRCYYSDNPYKMVSCDRKTFEQYEKDVLRGLEKDKRNYSY
jgi:hypothetical protein